MIVPGSGRVKVHWLDLVILAGIVALILFVGYRVQTVLVYHWDWSRLPQYFFRWDPQQGRWVANLLVQGFTATLRLSLWCSFLAGGIGLVMGLCRVSHSLFFRLIGRTYVELIRNIPPLVFIFIFYFFVSSQIMPMLGIEAWLRRASPRSLAIIDALFGKPALLPNFVSGLICLAWFEGAYVTEIVRAGIQSIDKGQWEAGTSLGLTRYWLLRDVILPQAVQRILPPMAGQFIALIKDSSIVSLISIQELTFLAAEVAGSTTRIFEVWITVAVMYFVICFACSLGFGRLETRMAAGRG